MQLETYLKNKSISVAEFASLIGTKSRATVHRYVKRQRIPDEAIMPIIYEVTGGLVTANDFYDLPTTPKRKR